MRTAPAFTLIAVALVLAIGAAPKPPSTSPIVDPRAAGPMADPRVAELNALPRKMATDASEQLDARFLQLALDPGIEWMHPDSMALVVARFGRFRPVLLAAQSGRRPPSFGIQALFRSGGRIADRDVLLTELRACAGDPARDPAVRVQTALILADWWDTGAVGPVRGLVDSLAPEDPRRAAAQTALERLLSSCARPLLAPDGFGKLHLCLSPGAVLEASVIATAGLPNERSRILEDAETRHLLAFLDGARETRGYSHLDTALRSLELRLHDGRRVNLEMRRDGTFFTREGRLPWLGAPLGVGLDSPELGRALVAAARKPSPSRTELPAERVRLEVDSALVKVEGRYVFRHSGPPAPLPILHPLPVDTTVGEPRLLLAHLLRWDGSVEELAATGDSSAWYWTLPMREEAPCTLLVSYEQPYRGDAVRYVLTSARSWGRGLKRADLEVVVPESATGVQFNYPLRLVGCTAGRCTYRLAAFDLDPAEDLVVSGLAPKRR
jgi:hypothetical protein